MKRTSILFLFLILSTIALTACDWRLRSPIVKETPAPYVVTPEPTPVVVKEYWSPTEGATWNHLTEDADYQEYENLVIPVCGPVGYPDEAEVKVIRGGQDGKDVSVFFNCNLFRTHVLGLPTLAEIYESTPEPIDNSIEAEANSCPEDADMIETALADGYVHFVFDGESVSWDPCKWHGYTEDGLTLENADWQATVVLHDGDEQSDPIVWRGPAEIDGNVSFTLRYIGEGSGYAADHWVNNDCQLLIQEYAFGLRRENWDYPTFEGNVTCDALDDLLANEVDVNDLPNAYTIAAVFGGESPMWTVKDWEGGAHLFAAGEHADGSMNFIKLEVPSWADSCEIDYWNGETGAADKLMPGDPGISLNEASLHCHADQ